MNWNTALSATVAIGAVGYALSPKHKKTELELKSKAAPIPHSYLPFQLDSNLMNIGSVLLGGDELELMREATVQYGNTVNFKFMSENFILVIDPVNIQHILVKNFTNYEKGPEFFDMFHDFLGSGIFNADGEQWKTQRSIARPHFMTNEFKDAKLINKHVDKLIEVINRQTNAHPDTPLDVQDLFLRFTLDASAEFLFGETVNALEEGHSDFSRAFNYAQLITAWRIRIPHWRWFVPSSRFKSEMQVLDEFVYRIIDNAIARKEKRESETQKPSDEEEKKSGYENMLEHFLSVQETPDRKYLRDMLMNFMIAGRDTTASLLTWSFWYLAHHPDVVERMREEIDRFVGDRVPDFEDIRQLKYMKQVVNEVLRLRPPVPYNMRQSVEEDVLPNGYYVPPRTTVGYSAYVTHRLKELWGEDAEEFNPDRWGPSRSHEIRPFMFVPFHAGPRICLGQNFAYTEAMTTLARLLPLYNVKLVSGFEPRQFADVVLFSHNGMSIIIEPRSKDE
ncbi:hypothetical protein BGZ73_008589 [Actinomortierella ambigua]|nr:hypothetical protein BGZ73_008589 [Actinomortierella ambigua]